MAKRDTRRSLRRSGRVETLEDRIVMSADPLGGLLGGGIQHHAMFDAPINQHGGFDAPISQHGSFDAPISQQGGYGVEHHIGFDGSLSHHVEATPDFSLGTTFGDLFDPAGGDVDTHLSSAHGQSGLTQVRNDYGFLGTGQTVVVIDSGIAYDHAALGGGFGTSYRVVGGWDFTEENDSNPFDDGPAGSHGTHVAGIIGADSGSASTSGVAPGVDLVGLRVFNDNGDGYFSWVENALQWVHDHRNDFNSGITAVNLSLGTDWNSDTIPGWAMVEEEFAQLEADGIFISVSAGNSFTSYNTPGLSYPAASPHVVPVMATSDDGTLAYFSQRHDRAIAAPGRFIYSTVPDYVGNQNGITDDWANMSGTSMAAPYLAGASVIVREAMQFVGMTNITQDTIYDHIRSTADIFHDSATNANYHRLNLETAIDALMPTDDYGSSVGTAHSLGTVGGNTAVAGLIGQLDDTDFFTFTAGVTGNVEFSTDTTHDLAANWQLDGGGGTVSGAHGEVFTIDVAAGQSYTVGLSTSDGIGYYDLSIAAEEVISAIDWGVAYFTEYDGLSNASGETWYQFQASQSGFLTAEAFFANAGGNVNLQLYNAQQQLLDSSTSAANWERVDYYASAGDVFLLRVSGANSDVDFRLSNLVSLDGATAQIDGTSGADVFTFEAGASQVVTVNGVMYSFDAGDVTAFEYSGGGGTDRITLTGTSGNETATLRVGQVTLSGVGFSATGTSVEHVFVHGGGGDDAAHLYDSAGDDRFRAWHNRAILDGNGFYNFAQDFDSVRVYASTGYDTATFYGSSGDDLFRGWDDLAIMSGTGFYNRAHDFDRAEAFSTGGNDSAIFYDSAGDDLYRGWNDRAIMSGSGFYNRANDFHRTEAHATAGYDTAIFYDSDGDDLYRAWDDRAIMSGSGFYNWTGGFNRTEAYATAGYDTAIFYDSDGDDLYRAWDDRAIMSGSGFYNWTGGFNRTEAYATAGYDTAIAYDSDGDDLYRAWDDRAIMSGSGFYNWTGGFNRTEAYATAGHDTAIFYDSDGDDLYRAWDDLAIMSGSGFYHRAADFYRTEAYSTAGNDTAILYDSPGDDLYRAWDDLAIMSGSGFYHRAADFYRTEAYSTTGNDTAIFYDSAGDDLYRGWDDLAIMSGSGFYHRAADFYRTEAYSTAGNDIAIFYDSAGDDLYRAWDDLAIMSGSGFYHRAADFYRTEAHSTGGNDTAIFYDSVGDDLYRAWDDMAIMSGSGFYNRANGFDQATGYATGGNDQAILYDSAFDDLVATRTWGAFMSGGASYKEARGFENIQAQGINGGNNASDLMAVDYLFTLVGDWD